MKEWLVDVPVKTNIWIRPDCQRKQFEVIKKARPSILFVQSDGGRNDEEWKLIRQNRKIFDEEIDWDCTVYRFYEDKNLGLYSMARKVSSFIWKKVDRCIFLEDDILPSVSFFRFCAEMLEKYKDDMRVNCICGMNHLGVSENVNSDYFFSREGSIWGIAMWKRMHDQYYDFSYGNDPYILELLKQRTRHRKELWKQIIAYSNGKYYDAHVASSEFFIPLSTCVHNQLQIIPKYNLCSNIGCTGDSVHADDLKNMPKSMRRIFNMKVYEIEFPLKEAKYVIPDVEYEKKRNLILANGHPIISFTRKVQRAILVTRHKGIKTCLIKIRNSFDVKNNRKVES